ncbi:MAG TPA: hypothetical protein VGR96_06165 [Acidobacteriaceae bacterium]|nr:hypothetical protein [Acidobacteriaceae bacterium]
MSKFESTEGPIMPFFRRGNLVFLTLLLASASAAAQPTPSSAPAGCVRSVGSPDKAVSEIHSPNSYLQDFFDASFCPETVAEPVVTAAFSNWVSRPAGFGDGWNAYGYHYGVSVTDDVNGKFMRSFVFAWASHHRDTFTPIENGTAWKRLGLALEHSIFLEPGKSRAFNWSGLPASLASAALSNAYQPAEQQTVSATAARFGTNCAGYAFGNVWTQLLHNSSEKHRAIYRIIAVR